MEELNQTSPEVGQEPQSLMAGETSAESSFNEQLEKMVTSIDQAPVSGLNREQRRALAKQHHSKKLSPAERLMKSKTAQRANDSKPISWDDVTSLKDSAYQMLHLRTAVDEFQKADGYLAYMKDVKRFTQLRGQADDDVRAFENDLNTTAATHTGKSGEADNENDFINIIATCERYNAIIIAVEKTVITIFSMLAMQIDEAMTNMRNGHVINPEYLNPEQNVSVVTDVEVKSPTVH
ncbi:MAG: hypothetical protein E6Q68_00830 [Polynucleobacter sp.]|nr:MAG: hypothetical protein E6Q68_00830 [Polynucleobacter sp.]